MTQEQPSGAHRAQGRAEDAATGSAQITFWFEFASTYSYLSAMRIDAQAARRGIRVVWRPFLLGPIFAAQGWRTSPFSLYPAKGRYMWRDVARQAAAQGVSFQAPGLFPQNGLLAARVATAALERAPARGAAFCRAVYEAEFAHGQQIEDRRVLAACLTRAGLDLDFLETAEDERVKRHLRRVTKDAADLGIFGAPSFVVGEELFWGDDRLEAALDFAVAGPAIGKEPG